MKLLKYYSNGIGFLLAELETTCQDFVNNGEGMFKGWFSGIGATQEELDKFHKSDKPIRFTGSVHIHADNTMWISGRGALLKEIKTDIDDTK